MRAIIHVFLLAALAIAPCLAQESDFSPSAASLYERGLNALSGSGATRDETQGVEYIRRAADLGYAPAQTAMGYFYDTGNFQGQEPQQALSWYQKAAQQGDRLAQWCLGRLYLNSSGVPRDLDQAERWLRQAAGQGDPFGAYLLGMVMQERDSYGEAASWFRKAAEQGLPPAQQKLGQLLMDGKGVPRDKAEAYVWLLVSYDNGNRAAAVNLSLLESDLGRTKLEAAKSRARSLEQSTARSVTAGGCTGWRGEFYEYPTPPPLEIQERCR